MTNETTVHNRPKFPWVILGSVVCIAIAIVMDMHGRPMVGLGIAIGVLIQNVCSFMRERQP